jgi:hypothetical protein
MELLSSMPAEYRRKRRHTNDEAYDRRSDKVMLDEVERIVL